jgi:hypothetical protein
MQSLQPSCLGTFADSVVEIEGKLWFNKVKVQEHKLNKTLAAVNSHVLVE